MHRARVGTMEAILHKSETNSNFLAWVRSGLDRHRIQFRAGEREERKRKGATTVRLVNVVRARGGSSRKIGK
jgi:hypothetical protein